MPMTNAMTATAADLMPKEEPSPVPPRAPLPLRTAQSYANKIAEWIAPFCLQIESVGELRRRATICHILELLVVPRHGPGDVNLLYRFLNEYIQNSKGRARWQQESGRGNVNGWPTGAAGVSSVRWVNVSSHGEQRRGRTQRAPPSGQASYMALNSAARGNPCRRQR